MTANAPLTDSFQPQQPVQPQPQPQQEQQEAQRPEQGSKLAAVLQKLNLTEADVEQLKKQYGSIELVVINNQPYLYRPLFRQELRSIRKNIQGMDEMVLEEKIVSKCVVAPRFDPMNMSHAPAGLITTLATLIYASSGYEIEARPAKL